MGIYVTLAHVLAAVGLITITACKWQTLLWAFILWPISGFGITVGVHRLWSHRSYQANVIVTPGSEFDPTCKDSIRLNFSQNHSMAVSAANRIVKMVEIYKT